MTVVPWSLPSRKRIILTLLLMVIVASLFATAPLRATESSSIESLDRLVIGQRYMGLIGESLPESDWVSVGMIVGAFERLLADLDSGRIFVQSVDAELLRDLVVDYQSEVVSLRQDLGLLSDELVEQRKRDGILAEQIMRSEEEVNRVTEMARILETFVIDQSQENRRQISVLSEDSHEELSARLDQLQGLYDESRKSIRDLFTIVNAIQSQQEEMRRTVSSLSRRVDLLESYRTSSVSDVNPETEDDPYAVVQAQAERISGLEQRIAELTEAHSAEMSFMREQILILTSVISLAIQPSQDMGSEGVEAASLLIALLSQE